MAKGWGAASRRVYRPGKYWHERGFDYEPVEREADISHFVSTMRSVQPRSILDVGSGVGTLYNEMKDAGYRRPYKMCDISSTLAARAWMRTGERPDIWNGKTLPYGDGTYDLVLSFAVLLHVPDASLAHSFSEHVRVADKYIYIYTYTGPAPPTLHCFSHDYYGLFQKFGLNVLSEHVTNQTRNTHWLLKKN